MKMDDSLPKISIVTPSFNQGEYLEETIRSVLTQNYPNLQYVIMDGGSTDQSVSIIERYADRLDAWVSEPDQGQADAINKGFARCDGEIMGWLNSDDLLLPNALHHIGRHFAENPQTNIVCGFRRFAIGHQRTRGRWVHLEPDRFSLQRHCYIAQETTYWRRSVWEAVGELDPTFQFTLDYDLWQRMLVAGYAFELIPYYLGLFRLHEASKTVSQNCIRIVEHRRIYQRYLQSAKGIEDHYREIHRQWRVNMWIAHYAAHARLLSYPPLAKRIIHWLTPASSVGCW